MKKTKEEKKVRRRKVWEIIGFLALLTLIIHVLAVNASQLLLRKYIRSFDKVQYTSQLKPQIGEEGYWTFTTDDDFNILQLNDLHICGGYASYKKDKKTVYEIITMVQKEKPDLLILNGDSVFAVPYIGFNGGATFNNKMVSKTVKYMFEHLGVYFSVTFGNHDTEAFDFTRRKSLGKMYADKDNKYCIFTSNYTGYGVTNQCILLKNTKGSIRKAIMLLDSNDYINNSLSATINWKYDTIHDEQVEWAKSTITSLSDEKCVKSLFFFHIPVGEFATAYRELESNNFEKNNDSEYISGFWDEKIDKTMGERIWYGGCCQTDKDPKEVDCFFEELGPDGLDTLEGVFCAHDHVNTAVVKYKGVYLAYGNSLDNNAYTDIAKFGLQRGSMLVTIMKNNSIKIDHRNVYTFYNADSTKFFDVNLTDYYYPDWAPSSPKED